MKQLILIRHGEAPREPAGTDFDRELNDLGRNQALLSAKYLEKYKIGHVLCSPVPRTRQTYSFIRQHLGLSDEIVDFAPSIYENCHNTLARLVDLQTNECDTMLIVGHNPSLIQLSIYYDTEPEDKWHDKLSLGLKPAEIIVLQFDKAENWGQTCHAGGKITDIFIPKVLQD